MQEVAPTASSEVEDAQLPYIILPNGKKRFTRATRVDIIVSLLLPIIGISVAHGAYSIGESRRAGENAKGERYLVPRYGVLVQLTAAAIGGLEVGKDAENSNSVHSQLIEAL